MPGYMGRNARRMASSTLSYPTLRKNYGTMPKRLEGKLYFVIAMTLA